MPSDAYSAGQTVRGEPLSYIDTIGDDEPYRHTGFVSDRDQVMADQNLTAQVARLADRVEGFARKLDSVSAAPAAPPPWKTVSFWIPVVLAVIGLAGIDRSLGLLNTRISDLAAVVSSLDQRLTPAVEKLNERNAELDKRLALDEASKAPRP